MIDIIKRNKLATVLVVAVLGYFLLGITVRFIQAYQFEGEWGLFDSQDYVQAKTFPDGFRLDYPTSWEVSTLEKGGTKNLGELRASFIKPNYLFLANTYLDIWWRRVDETWTLDDARIWFVEDVPFGINRSELEQKRDTFQEITVGKGDYPALTQTFVKYSGKNPRKQVFILVVGDEAFAFSFKTNNYDEETRQIFQRMLDTLEIYE